MTYKESYEKCNTVEELRQEVVSDMATAITIGNLDRLNVIKETAEEVVNAKFNCKISDLLEE